MAEGGSGGNEEGGTRTDFSGRKYLGRGREGVWFRESKCGGRVIFFAVGFCREWWLVFRRISVQRV